MIGKQGEKNGDRLIATIKIVNSQIKIITLNICLKKQKLMQLIGPLDKENEAITVQIIQTQKMVPDTEGNEKTVILKGYMNINGEQEKLIVIKRNKKNCSMHQVSQNELVNEIIYHKKLSRINENGILKPIVFSTINQSPCQEDLKNIFIVFQQLKGYHSMQKQILKRDFAQKVFIFQQICKTIKILHQDGFIHRDISLANILIDQKGNYPLTDLGLAIGKDLLKQKLFDTDYKAVGTASYMCPIIYQAQQMFKKLQNKNQGMSQMRYFQYGCQIDIWALGNLFANQFVDSSTQQRDSEIEYNAQYFKADKEQFQKKLEAEVSNLKLRQKEKELYKQIQRICKQDIKRYYEQRNIILKKQDEQMKEDYGTTEILLPEVPNFIDDLIKKIQRFVMESSKKINSLNLLKRP